MCRGGGGSAGPSQAQLDAERRAKEAEDNLKVLRAQKAERDRLESEKQAREAEKLAARKRHGDMLAKRKLRQDSFIRGKGLGAGATVAADDDEKLNVPTLLGGSNNV